MNSSSSTSSRLNFIPPPSPKEVMHICFMCSTNNPGKQLKRVCNCDVSRGLAHEECLLERIRKGRYKGLRCPQCQTSFKIASFITMLRQLRRSASLSNKEKWHQSECRRIYKNWRMIGVIFIVYLLNLINTPLSIYYIEINKDHITPLDRYLIIWLLVGLFLVSSLFIPLLIGINYLTLKMWYIYEAGKQISQHPPSLFVPHPVTSSQTEFQLLTSNMTFIDIPLDNTYSERQSLGYKYQHYLLSSNV